MGVKKVNPLGFRLGVSQFWHFFPHGFFLKFFIFLYFWISNFFYNKRIFLGAWRILFSSSTKIVLRIDYLARRFSTILRAKWFFRRSRRQKNYRLLLAAQKRLPAFCRRNAQSSIAFAGNPVFSKRFWSLDLSGLSPFVTRIDFRSYLQRRRSRLLRKFWLFATKGRLLRLVKAFPKRRPRLVTYFIRPSFKKSGLFKVKRVLSRFHLDYEYESASALRTWLSRRRRWGRRSRYARYATVSRVRLFSKCFKYRTDGSAFRRTRSRLSVRRLVLYSGTARRFLRGRKSLVSSFWLRRRVRLVSMRAKPKGYSRRFGRLFYNYVRRLLRPRALPYLLTRYAIRSLTFAVGRGLSYVGFYRSLHLRVKGRLLLYMLWRVRLLRFFSLLQILLSRLSNRYVTIVLNNVLAVSGRGPSFADFFSSLNVSGWALGARKVPLLNSIKGVLVNYLIILRNDLSRFRVIRGFQDFLCVILLGVLCRQTFVFRQWLHYYFEPLRKHDINVDQNRLLNFFSAGLGGVISLTGYVNAFRLEVKGKINDSLRTRRRVYGSMVRKQDLAFTSVYGQYSIRTFTGVFSFRIWLF